MAIETLLLDPLAVPYTDDEIVSKVNAAAVNISRAGSVEAAARPIVAGEVGATELEHEAFLAAEKTKLTGIEDGAKDDQTGTEIRDIVVALPDTERKIILTNPISGQYKAIAIQVTSNDKVAVDKDDVPIP